MSEAKDPAIKLFGTTIRLPSNDDVSAAAELVVVECERSSDQSLSCSNVYVSAKSQDDKNDAATDSKLEDGSSSTIMVDSNEDPTKSSIDDNPTTPSGDKESLSLKPSHKEEQSETSSSQEKPLKKPDKILPCPRCNSMDTKFCYFNNYNVNQPRHFCRNCQRYWTAGGTMRNVPVGAGRRKTKNSSHHHRHIIIPDFLQPHPYPSNPIIYPALRANGPLFKSMASAHNIANGSCNTSSKPINMGVNRDTQELPMKSFHGLSPQVPCFPAPPWPHPWSPAQWRLVPAQPYLPSGFPVSIYAEPPYWGCGVSGSWHMPWLQSPNSPLGKHLRYEDVLGSMDCNNEKHREERKERKVLVPKTLRIDDPNEAAKSSIWATLGIRKEKADSINSSELFRGFQSKSNEMSSGNETSLVLQANPAALSRSLTFNEIAQ